ncbi:Bug family tripartite tricarboxylate transporter substrate binding protein [Sedimentimonas flavescens]|nr:tripartite tricarboxylate transporter substrate-binding protein [Sedimentimonas flavescens]
MNFRKFLMPLPLATLALAAPVHAGDTVALQVGYGPGGSFDIMARLFADHLGKHLDGNPTVIVENVPGAGSLKLAKMIADKGTADGSQIGTISGALGLTPVFEPENPGFDPANVRYIASASRESSYCITPKSSGISSLAEFVKSNGKAGATGKTSSTYTYAAAIKSALGGSYDIVTGFDGGNEIDLAMERGDIQVRCGISLTVVGQADMLERYVILGEIGTVSKGPITDEPFILDLVTDPTERAALELVFSSTQMHHPYIVSKETPEETVAALRKAFSDTVADPAFVADAKTRGVIVELTDGAEVEARIEALRNSDPAIVQRAREMVQ